MSDSPSPVNPSAIPSDYLRQVCPAAGTDFKSMRAALGEAGPLDYETREYIIVSGFALMGYEEPFKIHVARLFKLGVPIENLRHAVLVALGATAPMYPVVRALRWLEEAMQLHTQEQAAQG